MAWRCKYCGARVDTVRLATGRGSVCVEDYPVPFVVGSGHQHAFDADGHRKLGRILWRPEDQAKAEREGVPVVRLRVEHHDRPELIAAWEEKRKKSGARSSQQTRVVEHV